MDEVHHLDLPSSGEDQSCALCGNSEVSWAHPLDCQKIAYRQCGKGYTLPTFWILCEGCERLFEAGHDQDLLERMKASGGFRPEIEQWSATDIDEVLRKPLAVLRSADLGRVALQESDK